MNWYSDLNKAAETCYEKAMKAIARGDAKKAREWFEAAAAAWHAQFPPVHYTPPTIPAPYVCPYTSPTIPWSGDIPMQTTSIASSIDPRDTIVMNCSDSPPRSSTSIAGIGRPVSLHRGFQTAP